MTPVKSISYTIIAITIALYCCACGNGRSRSRNDNTTVNDNKIDSIPILPKPVLNIYIENSVSMRGYINGDTDFRQAVSNYIVDIDNKALDTVVNLYYINEKSIKPIGYGNKVADFPTQLKHSNFNGGTTDIAKMLDSILVRSNINTISVLVSDFIFSPGKNALSSFLSDQERLIKSSIVNFLNSNPNHGVIIYQLSSNFDGYFYDKFDKPYSYNGDRPYYIWIVGHKQHLGKLIKACPPADFKGGGVENIVTFEPSDITSYRIKGRTGEFDLDRCDKYNRSIINAKKPSKGCSRGKTMTFAINVDYSNLLCDDQHLMNIESYECNDNDYSYKITKSFDEGYTHSIYFSTEVVKPAVLNLKLKQPSISWVNYITDSLGVGKQAAQSNKTFGLKYLIDGVKEGYNVSNEYLTEMTIKINQ